MGRAPVFEHFFWSHFLMPFWSQMVSPREPKIAQNRQKSCSRGLPESTRQKVTKNDAIWEGWICNPHTPVQSKHTFSFSRFGRKSDPKRLPKAPQNRLKSIKKRFSSPCQNSCRKSCHTKRKKCQKVSKKGPPKGAKKRYRSFFNLRGSLFFGPFFGALYH